MDLLEEYIKSGRIKLNTHKFHETYTVHDPCNYVRKSVLLYDDEPTTARRAAGSPSSASTPASTGKCATTR